MDVERPVSSADLYRAIASAHPGLTASSMLLGMMPPPGTTSDYVDLEPDESMDDPEPNDTMDHSDVDSALGDVRKYSAVPKQFKRPGLIADLRRSFKAESVPSSTVSLRSSIVRAREENGRIYHGYKDGKYLLPTDQEELDRQYFQYQLCQLTFDNRLTFAPIDRPSRVLDVGCGVGIWAMDFGDQHPESEVIGIDLSPVQPGYTPPNVHYEIDDLEEEWSFSRNFDYIHCMMMTGAFRDWPKFFRQAFDNLNPGGWLEVQDINFPMKCDDGTVLPASNLARWNDLMMEAAQTSGFLLDTCGRAANMMQEAGFVEIVRIPYKWPINQWPRDARHKTLGEWTEANFIFGLESIMLALFTRFLGWRKEEVWDFIGRVMAEWRDVRNHAYFDVYVTYGKRP